VSPPHPNAQRILDLFASFRSGDVAAISAHLADDVVWRFPGRKGQIAGEHRGRDGVFSFLARVMQLTSGTFQLDFEGVVADDRWAVAMFRGHGQRDGKTLDNPTCLKMRLEGGKVAEVWEFVWNLYEVDEFWA
jgi:ketosteroid isomerase-like protein